MSGRGPTSPPPPDKRPRGAAGAEALQAAAQQRKANESETEHQRRLHKNAHASAKRAADKAEPAARLPRQALSTPAASGGLLSPAVVPGGPVGLASLLSETTALRFT